MASDSLLRVIGDLVKREGRIAKVEAKKVKDKLKLKKYNPNTRKHEFFVEKKLPPHSK